MLVEEVLLVIIRVKNKKLTRISNKVRKAVLTYKLRNIIIEYNQLIFNRKRKEGKLLNMLNQAYSAGSIRVCNRKDGTSKIIRLR